MSGIGASGITWAQKSLGAPVPVAWLFAVYMTPFLASLYTLPVDFIDKYFTFLGLYCSLKFVISSLPSYRKFDPDIYSQAIVWNLVRSFHETVTLAFCMSTKTASCRWSQCEQILGYLDLDCVDVLGIGDWALWEECWETTSRVDSPTVSSVPQGHYFLKRKKFQLSLPFQNLSLWWIWPTPTRSLMHQGPWLLFDSHTLFRNHAFLGPNFTQVSDQPANFSSLSAPSFLLVLIEKPV